MGALAAGGAPAEPASGREPAFTSAGRPPAADPAALDAAAPPTAALADSRSSRDARCGSARSWCLTAGEPGWSLMGAAGSASGRSRPDRSDRPVRSAPAAAAPGAARPADLSGPVLSGAPGPRTEVWALVVVRGALVLPAVAFCLPSPWPPPPVPLPARTGDAALAVPPALISATVSDTAAPLAPTFAGIGLSGAALAGNARAGTGLPNISCR